MEWTGIVGVMSQKASPPAQQGKQGEGAGGTQSGWLRANAHWWIPAAVFLLLRIPSFIEPLWYTDEAGYASTVWLSHLGYGLYVNAWNNKPPLLFALMAGTLRVFGPTEAGLHVLPLLTGGGALCGALWWSRRNLSRRTTLVAGIVIAVLFGAPFLDGELFLPESLLVIFTTWACVWFIVVIHRQDASQSPLPLRHVVGIGVLLSCAALIQQTAIADASAILAWCIVRRQYRAAGALVATMGGLGLAVMGPFVVEAGFHRIFFALVSSYGGYVTQSLSTKVISYAWRLALVIAFAGSIYALRRVQNRMLEFLRIWFTAELIVAIAPGYPYEHFLLPAVIPVTLGVSYGIATYWEKWKQLVRSWKFLLSTGLLAWCGVASCFIFTQPYGGLYHAGWSLGYYPVTVGRMMGAVTTRSYDDFFGFSVYGESVAMRWIHAHHLDGSYALVWSNLAWPLVVNRLSEPTRSGPLYVTQTLDNGPEPLIARLEKRLPAFVIVTPHQAQFNRYIRKFLAQHSYRKELDVDGVQLYLPPSFSQHQTVR